MYDIWQNENQRNADQPFLSICWIKGSYLKGWLRWLAANGPRCKLTLTRTQMHHALFRQCKHSCFFTGGVKECFNEDSCLTGEGEKKKLCSHPGAGTGQRVVCETDRGHLALLCQFLQLVGFVLRFYESLLYIFQRLSRGEGCERLGTAQEQIQKPFILQEVD